MEKKEVCIKQFLDEDGRITKLPAKYTPRLAVLRYLAGKFEPGRIYAEKEINEKCDEWHTFSDYFILRRLMVDEGLLARERDGSAYWLAPEKEDESDE